MVKIFPISLRQTRSTALKFINEKKPRGYMTCLKSFVESKFIDEFKSVGFIKTGYTRKAETYSVTELGKQFWSEIK